MSDNSSSLRILVGAGVLAVTVGAVAAWSMVRSERAQAPQPIQAVMERVPGETSQEARHGLTIELPPATEGTEGATETIAWQDLVPAEGEGVAVRFDTATEAREGAPKRQEFPEFSVEDFDLALLDIDDMRAMQVQESAIRTDLDGKTIRIAGYVTPVGFDDTRVTDFLLVPFLGACIHVPPPPANQIVFVGGVSGLSVANMYEPIWVTGILRSSPVATVLADVGYRLENATVEPYR